MDRLRHSGSRRHCNFISTGFSCISLSPAAVNASGLGLQGLSFAFKTPYTIGGNFTLQYQLQPTLTVQAAYVDHARSPSADRNWRQQRAADLAQRHDNRRQRNLQLHSIPRFQWWQLSGNGRKQQLQRLADQGRKEFTGGLNFLATYTWSKDIFRCRRPIKRW